MERPADTDPTREGSTPATPRPVSTDAPRLTDRETFTDLVTSSAEEGLCAFDADGRIVFSNPSAQRMLGWSGEHLLGRPVQTIVDAPPPAPSRDAPQASVVARVLDTGEPVRRHWEQFTRHDGSRFPVSYTAAPLIESERVVGGVLAFHDITELTRAQEQLQRLNETLEQRVVKRTAEAQRRADQLHAMAYELAQAEQRERRRLSKLLHDHVQQLLVAIKMRLRTLGDATPGATPNAVAEAETLLVQTIDAVRSLSAEIAPPVLYDFGLNAALEWLARWMSRHQHLQVELETEDAAEVLDESRRVMIFDAIRELLLNVVKHANVAEARICVEAGEQALSVAVEDFGQGFDPAMLEQTRCPTGHGLASLEQRLGLIGARVEIDSAPGAGTRIRINVPLDSDQHAPGSDDTPTDAADTAHGNALDIAPPATGHDVRVLLADDHEVVREGMANLIDQQAQMRVIGEASTGEQAVELADALRPDIVVMDISLPGISGIEATRLIKQKHPQMEVIGLSMHEEQDVAESLRSAGAAAFVSKTRPTEDLLTTISKLFRAPRDPSVPLSG